MPPNSAGGFLRTGCRSSLAIGPRSSATGAGAIGRANSNAGPSARGAVRRDESRAPARRCAAPVSGRAKLRQRWWMRPFHRANAIARHAAPTRVAKKTSPASGAVRCRTTALPAPPPPPTVPVRCAARAAWHRPAPIVPTPTATTTAPTTPPAPVRCATPSAPWHCALAHLAAPRWAPNLDRRPVPPPTAPFAPMPVRPVFPAAAANRQFAAQ